MKWMTRTEVLKHLDGQMFHRMDQELSWCTAINGRVLCTNGWVNDDAYIYDDSHGWRLPCVSDNMLGDIPKRYGDAIYFRQRPALEPLEFWLPRLKIVKMTETVYRILKAEGSVVTGGVKLVAEIAGNNWYLVDDATSGKTMALYYTPEGQWKHGNTIMLGSFTNHRLMTFAGQ